MLDHIIKQIAIGMLLQGNTELYWDLMYIIKFGIPKEQPVAGPVDPNIDPYLHMNVNERLRLHDELIFDLVGVLDGDPNPQPSVINALQDTKIRLEAIKGLAQRLESALGQAKTEIERLDKIQSQKG